MTGRRIDLKLESWSLCPVDGVKSINWFDLVVVKSGCSDVLGYFKVWFKQIYPRVLSIPIPWLNLLAHDVIYILTVGRLRFIRNGSHKKLLFLYSMRPCDHRNGCTAPGYFIATDHIVFSSHHFIFVWKFLWGKNHFELNLERGNLR